MCCHDLVIRLPVRVHMCPWCPTVTLGRGTVLCCHSLQVCLSDFLGARCVSVLGFGWKALYLSTTSTAPDFCSPDRTWVNDQCWSQWHESLYYSRRFPLLRNFKLFLLLFFPQRQFDGQQQIWQKLFIYFYLYIYFFLCLFVCMLMYSEQNCLCWSWGTELHWTRLRVRL